LLLNAVRVAPGTGSSSSTSVLQPLANNLLREEDLSKAEPKFPLRLAVCQSCWLLQILDLIPPVQLFSEYLYFSSFSDLMLRHAKEAAERYIKEFELDQIAWLLKSPAMTAISSKISRLLACRAWDRAGAEYCQSCSREGHRDSR